MLTLTAGPHLSNSPCVARAQSCPNCQLPANQQKKKERKKKALTETKHFFINYVQTAQVIQTEHSLLSAH